MSVIVSSLLISLLVMAGIGAFYLTLRVSIDYIRIKIKRYRQNKFNIELSNFLDAFEVKYKTYVSKHEADIVCKKLANQDTTYTLKVTKANFKQLKYILSMESLEALATIQHQVEQRGYKVCNSNWSSFTMVISTFTLKL
jgi:hypothetical protein